MNYKEFLTANDNNKTMLSKTPFAKCSLKIKSIDDGIITFTNRSSCFIDTLVESVYNKLGYISNPELLENKFSCIINNFDVNNYIKENLPYRCLQYIYIEDKKLIYALCEIKSLSGGIFCLNIEKDTCKQVISLDSIHDTFLYRYKNAIFFTSRESTYSGYEIRLNKIFIGEQSFNKCDAFERNSFVTIDTRATLSDRFVYLTLSYSADEKTDKIVILDFENAKIYPIHTKSNTEYEYDFTTTLVKKYISHTYNYKRKGGKVLSLNETDGKIILDFELYWFDTSNEEYISNYSCDFYRIKIFKDNRPAILYSVTNNKESEMFA